MNLAMRLFKIRNQVLSIVSPGVAARLAAPIFLTPRRRQLKPWEKLAEDSGHRFNLDENISAICWTPDTPSHTQKKVLLVHGWESRATQMYGFVPMLLQQGYQVFAVDMPAHGLSEGVLSDAAQFAERLLLAEKIIGKFDVIIAHSMGAGAVCHAIAKGLSSDKLILIACASSIEFILNRFAGFIGLNKKASEYFVDVISDKVGQKAAEMDSITMAHKNTISTLLVHDKFDFEVPISESVKLVPIFTNSEMLITEGLGHRKILKSKQVFQKIHHFLLMPSLS